MGTGEFVLVIEVDTNGIKGEKLDFVKNLDLCKKVLRLRGRDELERSPLSAAVSAPAASPAGAGAPAS